MDHIESKEEGDDKSTFITGVERASNQENFKAL